MIFFSIFADLSAEAAALWKQDYVNSELEYQDEIFLFNLFLQHKQSLFI